MAVYRNVNMSFWTDTKVTDDYTPEDRYFMLYALTNNYTNIIGCYEISITQMSRDLGYTKDVIENLLNRFQEVHKTIEYDFNTKELFIVNWSKYNWNASPKLDGALFATISKVKSARFYNALSKLYNERDSVEDVLELKEEDEIPTKEIILFDKTTPTKRIEKIVADKPNYEDEFNLIWKEYPRKQGKAASLKSYIKARKKGVAKEDIWTGLQNYLLYIEREKVNPKYIKQGSTWFNQECWNDDYIVRKEATTADLQVDMSIFRR